MSDPFASASALNVENIQNATPFILARSKLLAESSSSENDAKSRSLCSIINFLKTRSVRDFLDEETVYPLPVVKPFPTLDSPKIDDYCYWRRPKIVTSRYSSNGPYLHVGREQSILLLDLPLEVLEQIAFFTRYPPPQVVDQPPIASTAPGSDHDINPIHPNLQAATQFISHRYSSFSVTRFTVSSLSRTCKAFRGMAIRLLYQDITLDCQGLAGRKHPRYPAGSLKLLLRTLQDRPCLRRLITSVAIDYFSLSGNRAVLIEQALEQLLERLPNLVNLVITPCPVKLWTIPGLSNLQTFGTMYMPGLLGATLESLPNLRHLHLQGNIPMEIADENHTLGRNDVQHSLNTLSIKSDNSNAVSHFMSIMKLCGNTVDTLDFTYLGSLTRPTPKSHLNGGIPETIFPGTCLRILKLDNISVFADPESALARLISTITTLEHLHLSHHDVFADNAFSFLPPRLKTLFITEYFPRWDQPSDKEEAEKRYGEALGRCVLFAPERVKIEAVTGWTYTSYMEDRFSDIVTGGHEVLVGLEPDCTSRGVVKFSERVGIQKPAVEFKFQV